MSKFIIQGCAIPDDNSGINEHPSWISQKSFEEFPTTEFIHAIGVSDLSFDEARQRARADLKKQIMVIIRKYVDKESGKGYSQTTASSEPKTSGHKIAELFFGKNQTQSNKDSNQTKPTNNLEDKNITAKNLTVLNYILLDDDKQIFTSWAEYACEEQKKYSHGFTFYTLITLDTKKVADFWDNKEFCENPYKNKELTEPGEILLNQVIRYANVFQKAQAYLYLQGLKLQDAEAFKKLNTKIGHNSQVIDAFTDIEQQTLTEIKKIKLSLTNNYQCGKINTYLNDLKLRITWGKTEIKLPATAVSSNNQAIIEILEIPDVKDYKVRLRPLKLTNPDGAEEVTIKINFDKFRLPEFFDKELKITVRYFLPTKENSIIFVQPLPEFPDDELEKPSAGLNAIACSNISNKILTEMIADGYSVDYWGNRNSAKNDKFIFNYHLKIIVNETRIISNSKKSLVSVTGLMVLYQIPSQAVDTGIKKIVKERETNFKFTGVYDKSNNNQDEALTEFSRLLVKDQDFQKKLLRLLSPINKIQESTKIFNNN